jgi:hypothetical protein
MQSVPITTDEFESRSERGVQHYVINLSVTCDRSVVFSGSSTSKTDCHDITEILLKVALNTIKQTNIMYRVIKYNKNASPVHLMAKQLLVE